MKTLILICCSLFITSTSLLAQSRFSGWVASFNTIKVSKKFSVHAEAQLRSTDEWKQTQNLLLRAGLTYEIIKDLGITAGLAQIRTYSMAGNETRYSNEQRIWEQLQYRHKVFRYVPLTHRLRVEQRYVSPAIVPDGQWRTTNANYSNRARYSARAIIPWEKTSNFTKGAYTALQDELFMNFGDNDKANGKSFDQNRLNLAMGYRFCKQVDAELGYINQYQALKGRAFTNNHILQVAIYTRL